MPEERLEILNDERERYKRQVMGASDKGLCLGMHHGLFLNNQWVNSNLPSKLFHLDHFPQNEGLWQMREAGHDIAQPNIFQWAPL